MMLFVAYQRFASELDFLPDNIMGFPTLLIAHIAFNVPYVIFNVTPKLKQLDIKLFEAALDLGCDPRQAFFKVILPEISPAILSGFLISLTYSIDDFMISLLQLRYGGDTAHRHLLHDPQEGQSGDLRAVHHHVRGHSEHHPHLQRHGEPRLPPRPARTERGDVK